MFLLLQNLDVFSQDFYGKTALTYSTDSGCDKGLHEMLFNRNRFTAIATVASYTSGPSSQFSSYSFWMEVC